MQQIADYACWHVMTGRGQNVAMLDQRGLDFFDDAASPGVYCAAS